MVDEELDHTQFFVLCYRKKISKEIQDYIKKVLQVSIYIRLSIRSSKSFLYIEFIFGHFIVFLYKLIEILKIYGQQKTKMYFK